VHTHPWAVWVSEEAVVYEWTGRYCYYSNDKHGKRSSRKGPRVTPKAVGMPKLWRKRFGARMPPKLLVLLQEVNVTRIHCKSCSPSSMRNHSHALFAHLGTCGRVGESNQTCL
jgi:hypothetical protein